jgi:anti-anti-sigma factor
VSADTVQVEAVRRYGVWLLRISGELDSESADSFTERVDAAVQGLTGSVLVDLSGLTFIDAGGARCLNAVLQTLPDGCLAAVRSCPRRVRRILDILGLSLDGQAVSGGSFAPGPGAPALLTDVLRARLQGGQARLDASRNLAELADTCIRLASTIERAGLVREQGRATLARSRVIREQSARSRPAPAR